MVPKAIMHFLVNDIRNNLQSELVTVLYDAEDVDDIVVESHAMIENRKAATEKLEELKKAKNIIEDTLQFHD